MDVEFSVLLGKTLTKIEGGVGDDSMRFMTDQGEVFELYHEQDCCESVLVEDISGDLWSILGYQILVAEEVSSDKNPPGYNAGEFQDSFTWTFYKLSTVKGSVTIRWYGESNGFYSESVYFRKIA